jgi:hypothetical protein
MKQRSGTKYLRVEPGHLVPEGCIYENLALEAEGASNVRE